MIRAWLSEPSLLLSALEACYIESLSRVIDSQRPLESLEDKARMKAHRLEQV